MSRKWCYWFREHAVLSRRFGGASSREAALAIRAGLVAGPASSTSFLDRQGTAGSAKTGAARGSVARAVDEVEQGRAAGGAAAKAEVQRLQRACATAPPGKLRRDALRFVDAEYWRWERLRALGTTCSRSVDVCCRWTSWTPEPVRARLPVRADAAHFSYRATDWHIMVTRITTGTGRVPVHCFFHLHLLPTRRNSERSAKERRSYRDRLLEPELLPAPRSSAPGFEVLAARHNLRRQDTEQVDARPSRGPLH